MLPALITAGASILGGLLGGKKGATNQVQSNAKSMDPTVRQWYFGSDGNGGLLGDLNNWYQANKTGLNPDMQAGLDHMRSVYQSPLATQGYERMANMGYNLMGQGVAGNPFLTGNMPNFGNLQPGQSASSQAPAVAQPAQQNLGLSNNWATQSPATAAPAPATPAAPTMDADTFRKLYEEELRRRRESESGWDASLNATAGFGA